MGLAASQMRLLALTAKKSNCEYQGQQINQQRLNLANQSSTIYSTIANLAVPVPPNPTGFSSASVPAPAPSTPVNPYVVTKPLVVKDAERLKELFYQSFNFIPYQDVVNGYFNDPQQTFKLDFVIQKVFTGDMGNIGVGDTEALLMQVGFMMPEEQDAFRDVWKEVIEKHYLGGEDYDVSGSELYDEFMTRAFGAGNYISATKLNQMYYKSGGDMNAFDSQINQWIDELSGNYIEYEYNPNPPTPTPSTPSAAGLTYEQAYAQYEADLVYYNAQMAALEAESANVHQKDKKLELQLKRIDTEHSAISTELDTVKKILDDNIESSFKTFS